MPHRRRIDGVGFPGMDQDSRNMVGIFQAHILPGFRAVGGFINPVAAVGTPGIEGFARSYPDDVRVGGSQGDVSDRQPALAVEHGFERRPIVDGFPNAPVSRAHIEGVEMRLGGRFGNGEVHDHGADPVRAEAAEGEQLQELFIERDLASAGNRSQDEQKDENDSDQEKSSTRLHRSSLMYPAFIFRRHSTPERAKRRNGPPIPKDDRENNRPRNCGRFQARSERGRRRVSFSPVVLRGS